MERLLIIENLEKRYEDARVFGTKKEMTALRGVSFSISAGSTLALVGESGSGKSTLALCAACLERPTSGKIVFDGNEITALNEKQVREIRPQIQLVFQDPARSLNPRFSALDCSVQAQIANLLLELQSSLGLTYLFITHDFAMAGHLADEIAVMERGRIVELGDADRVLREPGHETTRRLIAATPRLGAAAHAPQVG